MHRMARRACLVAALLPLTLMLPGVTAAFELRWLNDSPVRFFNDQDWELAKKAAAQALNGAADGETVTWSNPTSSHHGSFTPLSTGENAGMTCRRVQIRNAARHLSGGGIFEFCRKEDGTWGLSRSEATL